MKTLDRRPVLAIVVFTAISWCGQLAAQAPIDIHVVEQPPKNRDGASQRDVEELKERHITPLRVVSKKDMVSQIVAAVPEGKCIGNLYIYGHGSEGNINTGCGTKREECKHINGNRAEWEPILKDLKPKLCAGANVYLLACNVGSGEKGAEKLFELAKFLNATVHGPVDLVNGGENGKYLKSGRWQQASPEDKRAPNPISAAEEKSKKKNR